MQAEIKFNTRELPKFVAIMSIVKDKDDGMDMAYHFSTVETADDLIDEVRAFQRQIKRLDYTILKTVVDLMPNLEFYREEFNAT